MTLDATVIEKIIETEGDFVNDLSDRGGATKYGITRSTLSWWRGKPVTVEDVKNLSIPEAQEIYQTLYIKNPGFDRLDDSPFRNNLIDYGVHSGPLAAIISLQKIVGVKADGILGPVTLAAVKEWDPRKLNLSLVSRRMQSITNLVVKHPSQIKYLRGWTNRVLSFME